MKESTKRFWKSMGWRHPYLFTHGYIYFTQYDRYVKTLLGIARRYVRALPRGRFLFGYFFKRYHFKVLTEEQMTKILNLDHDIEVSPEESAKVVPFETANRVILREPGRIAVMDCPCRAEKGDRGCRPLNVCLAIGEPVVSFWLDHCADKYNARLISQEEALGIVRSERERGRILTSWFKDATGGKTGVFCNCCTCCCGGLEAVRLSRMLQIEDPPNMGAPSGYCARVDRGLCAGCGVCVGICPFKAVYIDSDGKSIVIHEKCLGCGICVDKCPRDARTLFRDETKGIPLDVDELG